MRWPWQRREEPAPQVGPGPRRDDAARVSPMGWAFLPPLQRQLGDMPLVARTASFPTQLPAWQNPSFTGTLAHRVSTDAPSGVIDGDGGGTGEPTLRSASPDLTLLAPAPVRPSPVQRAVATSSNDASAPVRAPLTTAATTGLPVLSVRSYEMPVEPDTSSQSAAHDVLAEGEVGAQPGEPAGEDPVPAVADPPPTAAESPAASAPLVQRATHAPGPASSATPVSPTSATVPSRPSVGGRRLGLGAPLPSLPLVSDVPPVQRSTDVPPALGSEGADGYVEVDIPSRPSRPDPPANATAEPDVPTLGPGSPPSGDRPAATGTPDAAAPAAPSMPVAPVQRSVEDVSDAATAEPFELPAVDRPSPVGTSGADDVSPADRSSSGESAVARTDAADVRDVPAPGTGDRDLDGSAPAAAVSHVLDRPVLAQRSLATPGDTTQPSRTEPPTGRTAASVVTPVDLRRSAAAPSVNDGPDLALQRSTDAPPTPVSTPDETSTDPAPTVDQAPTIVHVTIVDHPDADGPAPATHSAIDASTTEPDSGGPTETSATPPMALAPTRPMLDTIAPLTSLASAPLQRFTESTGARSTAGMQPSPPVLVARTTTHDPTVTSQTRSRSTHRAAGQPTQPAAVQRSAATGHPPRSVDIANGSAVRSSTSVPAPGSSGTPVSTGSPMSHVDGALSALPLAAPSVGDEPVVQTSLVEDPAEQATAVPDPASAPAEAREVGGTAPSASSAADAAGGAGGAAGASSPEQLEALAGRLFTPLMRRIRSEMLLDRERRGLRTDSW